MVLLGDCRPVGNVSSELVQCLRTACRHESAVPTVGPRTTTTPFTHIVTQLQLMARPHWRHFVASVNETLHT